MLKLRETTKFKKDMHRVMSQGKPYDKIRAVFIALLNQETLPEKSQYHSLEGNWKWFRELHVKPDWLLIYRVEGNTLVLERTGSHAELFGK